MARGPPAKNESETWATQWDRKPGGERWEGSREPQRSAALEPPGRSWEKQALDPPWALATGPFSTSYSLPTPGPLEK